MKTLSTVATLMAVAALAISQDRQYVFSDRSGAGQLWANLSLTYLRINEPYLPMVIGVQNLTDGRAKLNVDSFWLVGPDGSRYPLADLKTLRKEYDRYGLDHRVATAAGIPIDLWYRQRRLRDSNFFPDIRARNATVINNVTLGRRDGMVDLMYFVTPRGFGPNQPFLLEVRPKGWEVPLRLRLVLME